MFYEKYSKFGIKNTNASKVRISSCIASSRLFDATEIYLSREEIFRLYIVKLKNAG